MPKIEKARKRDAARARAKFAPRGGMSDRRPEAVRTDRGFARRLRKAMGR